MISDHKLFSSLFPSVVGANALGSETSLFIILMLQIDKWLNSSIASTPRAVSDQISNLPLNIRHYNS